MDREARLAERNQDVAAMNRMRRRRGEGKDFRVGDIVRITADVYKGETRTKGCIGTISEIKKDWKPHGYLDGDLVASGWKRGMVGVVFPEPDTSALANNRAWAFKPEEIELWEGE